MAPLLGFSVGNQKKHELKHRMNKYIMELKRYDKFGQGFVLSLFISDLVT
mgnify:FL=1